MRISDWSSDVCSSDLGRWHILHIECLVAAFDDCAIADALDDLPVILGHVVATCVQRLAVEHAYAPVVVGRLIRLRDDQVATLQHLLDRKSTRLNSSH